MIIIVVHIIDDYNRNSNRWASDHRGLARVIIIVVTGL